MKQPLDAETAKDSPSVNRWYHVHVVTMLCMIAVSFSLLWINSAPNLFREDRESTGWPFIFVEFSAWNMTAFYVDASICVAIWISVLLCFESLFRSRLIFGLRELFEFTAVIACVLWIFLLDSEQLERRDALPGVLEYNAGLIAFFTDEWWQLLGISYPGVGQPWMMASAIASIFLAIGIICSLYFALSLASHRVPRLFYVVRKQSEPA